MFFSVGVKAKPGSNFTVVQKSLLFFFEKDFFITESGFSCSHQIDDDDNDHNDDSEDNDDDYGDDKNDVNDGNDDDHDSDNNKKALKL